jgi:hypothetical protein
LPTANSSFCVKIELTHHQYPASINYIAGKNTRRSGTPDYRIKSFGVERSAHGCKDFGDTCLYLTAAFEMDDKGTLFSLHGIMTAHLNKRLDNMIEGIDVIIVQNKRTGCISALQLVIAS